MRLPVRSLACLAGFCMLATVACHHAWPAVEGSFERKLQVSGPVDLDVTTGSGKITVRVGSPSTVRVYGLIRARDSLGTRAEEKVRHLESNPPIEQTGNTIRIGRIEDHEYRNNVSIGYELEVPAETRLHSSTGSGSQSVDGIRGPVDVRTGSGSVTAVNIGDEVRARTGSGRIELDSIKGRVEANTGSGSVRATRIAGSFKGNTGSSNITVDLTAPGDVEAETGSGRIEASGVRGSLRAHTGSGRITAGGEPAGDWKLESSSGTITLRLTPQAAFDLFAHTSSGHITVNHPVTITGTISPREMRGKVRGGGAMIEARTSSGSIVIE